jgi:hypothetical protein
MKKTISLTLTAALLCSLCACGGDTASAEPSTSVVSSVESVQEESVQETVVPEEASAEEVSSAEAEEAEETDNDLIEFENVILVDNETLTMELVNFYAQDCNWSSGVQNEKYITVKVTNKTDHGILLNPDKFYLNDEEAWVSITNGSITPDAGKSGTYSFMVATNTMPEHTALDSLDELYGLEGTFDGLNTYDDDNNTSLEVSFSIPDALGAASDGDTVADNAQMKEQYAAVIQLLSEDLWYFNGGSDTILNGISFTEDAATITQVYFDGNGKHENGSNAYSYTIDDENITVTLSDGSDLVIPYVVSGDSLTLGNQEYFTPSEVDAGLQGYWEVRTSSSFGENEYHICFDNGSVQSESAAKSLFGSNGEYFYYGPYTGTYTLNFGGLDTEMDHGDNWFFNIIDGTVTLLHYDSVCSPSYGFPGQYGYSF